MFKKITPQILLNGFTILIVAVIVFIGQVYAASGKPEAVSQESPNGPAELNMIPGVISYQGALTDANGTPISDTKNIIFRLYNMPTGGTSLWEESQTVSILNGQFAVYLGSVVPFTNDVWQNNTLYLGIQVETDPEMYPRQPLSGVPYSISVPESSIGTAQLANASVTSEKLANDSINASKLDLQYGTVCLNETEEINLPGDWQAVIIPEFNLPMTLERSSHVLVWISGLAMYPQPSNVEVGLHLTINDVPATSCFSDQMSGWWNLDKSKIINLGPGQYTLQVKAIAGNSGTLSVHGGGGWQTCVNYLVIDED